MVWWHYVLLLVVFGGTVEAVKELYEYTGKRMTHTLGFIVLAGVVVGSFFYMAYALEVASHARPK